MAMTDPFLKGFMDEIEKEAGAKTLAAILASATLAGGSGYGGYVAGARKATKMVGQARAATHARYQRVGHMGLPPLEPHPVETGLGGIAPSPFGGGSVVGTGGTGVSAEMAAQAKGTRPKAPAWQGPRLPREEDPLKSLKARMEDMRKSREILESVDYATRSGDYAMRRGARNR
jgi:hypothetical protein